MAFTLEQLEAEKARRQGATPQVKQGATQVDAKKAFFEKYGKKEQTKEDFMAKYAKDTPSVQQDYADAMSGIEPSFVSKISDIYEKRKGTKRRG